MTFTIIGPPRTKKNSMRVVRAGNRARLLQSRAAMEWADSAIPQLRSQCRPGMWRVPVNLHATVYRDRDVGDLGNYLAAICDALEKAGVVQNDRLIGGFDGSRLAIDRERPRVEIELTPL